jgi:acyl-coenzyme A thioesterase PaaI-like protein
MSSATPTAAAQALQTPAPATTAIQDQLGDQPCWGCGPNTSHGLRIKSYWSGERSVCTWQAAPHHVGWPGVLNGGILAAVVDCHCVCTAIADAYQAEGRPLGSQPAIGYATGSLSISYLLPVPVDATLELDAQVTHRAARKAVIECTVTARGRVCARAEVVAVRLAARLDAGA